MTQVLTESAKKWVCIRLPILGSCEVATFQNRENTRCQDKALRLIPACPSWEAAVLPDNYFSYFFSVGLSTRRLEHSCNWTRIPFLRLLFCMYQAVPSALLH